MAQMNLILWYEQQGHPDIVSLDEPVQPQLKSIPVMNFIGMDKNGKEINAHPNRLGINNLNGSITLVFLLHLHESSS